MTQALDGESDQRKVESLLKVRFCVDAQLMQSELLVATLELYVFAARWIRRLIDPSNSGLPLASRIPMEYASLPEYYIDDMAEYLLFISRFALEIVEKVDVRPIIELFVVLIASNSYLTNPYLRAKLVEVFCSLSDNSENQMATFTKQKPHNNLSQ